MEGVDRQWFVASSRSVDLKLFADNVTSVNIMAQNLTDQGMSSPKMPLFVLFVARETNWS